MGYFGKVKFLLYDDVMVAKYEIVTYFTKQINKEVK